MMLTPSMNNFVISGENVLCESTVTVTQAPEFKILHQSSASRPDSHLLKMKPFYY